MENVFMDDIRGDVIWCSYSSEEAAGDDDDAMSVVLFNGIV